MGLWIERFFRSSKPYEVGKVYSFRGFFCEVTRIEKGEIFHKYFYIWRKDFDPALAAPASGSIEST